MSFVNCVFSGSEYKPKQGRLARLLFKSAGLIAAAALSFSANIFVPSFEIFSGINFSGGLVAIVAGWCCWRIIHYPPMADFLIDVQIESQRVSWSNWSSVRRTTVVVLVTMVTISIYLLLCDVLLQLILKSLGILNL